MRKTTLSYILKNIWWGKIEITQNVDYIEREDIISFIFSNLDLTPEHIARECICLSQEKGIDVKLEEVR